MGERAVYSTMAHVFQIDQETKKKWIPSSSSAVKVSYYHDPARKTYRIITIDNSKALVNSTITANMNFTKTSPKFGQWSDHRANTVFGLGFSSESDLVKFIDMFNEAKLAARELMKERQQVAQRLQDQEKPHPPSGSTLSPKSTSPPALITSFTSKSPSPSLTSPILAADISSVEEEVPSPTERLALGTSPAEREEPKSERWESEAATTNGNYSSPVESIKMSNGHGSLGDSDTSPDGKLDSLKTENNRLKLALASSATNVKKWDSEMQTLKNNNTLLQTTLEESKVNVSQWKAQLQKYKEENDSLKKRVQHLDAARKKESIATVEEMASIKKENEELKEVLSAVQIDLEIKTEDAHAHSTRADSADEELIRTKSKLKILEEDNQNYISQVSELEDQLKMASIASRRKIEDVQHQHKDIGQKLKELVELHAGLASHLEA